MTITLVPSIHRPPWQRAGFMLMRSPSSGYPRSNRVALRRAIRVVSRKSRAKAEEQSKGRIFRAARKMRPARSLEPAQFEVIIWKRDAIAVLVTYRDFNTHLRY
jgi:hypothetical protein